MPGQKIAGPNNKTETLTTGAPQPSLPPRSASPVSDEYEFSSSESDGEEVAGSIRSTYQRRTSIYGISPQPPDALVFYDDTKFAQGPATKDFAAEVTEKPPQSTTGFQSLMPEGQARLPNGPYLSSEDALQAIEVSANKVSYYGILFAALKGAVLGVYTVISLALIAISLTITLGGFTLTAILSAPVTVPLLIVGAIIAGAIVAYNYIKKEKKEQKIQQKLIEDNRSSDEIYNKTQEKIARFEKEFDAIYGNSLESYKTTIRRANLSKEKKEQLLKQLDEKYALTKKRALEKYESLHNSTAYYIRQLEESPEISMWQKFIGLFTTDHLTKKGSQFRNPMGVFEGVSSVLGGPAAGGTEPKGGTGFFTSETAGSAVGFTIASIWADLVHKYWIINSRRENIARLTKELTVREKFIKTASAYELETAQEWSVVARETLLDQGIDLPPAYEFELQNNVAELKSFYPAAELENLKSAYAKVSVIGRVLAGVRGFITGTYTIISLALIGFSLAIIFGGLTLGSILTPPLGISLLILVVLVGIKMYRSSVKKERAEQENLNSYIDVNQSSTKDYQTQVAIERKAFQAKFAQRHGKNLQENIKQLEWQAELLRLSPEETKQFVDKLKARYELIRTRAESDFSAVQFSVANKIKELNQPKPKLSILQTIKNGWKTFREKFTTWGSWIRSGAGGVEGASVIAGSSLAAAESFTPGTGFLGAAAGGVAIGGAALAVTANLTHQKLIVDPRNKSVGDLEKALKIKVDSANEAKKIDLIAYSQLAQATEEIEKEISQLAQKQATAPQAPSANQQLNLDSLPSQPKFNTSCP